MIRHARLLTFAFSLGCFAAITLLSSCTADPSTAGQAAIVPGPESNKLVPAASGYIVFERPYGGGISAVALPSLRETAVIPDPPADAADRPNVHAISGPDDQGRIAYVENHFFVADDKDRRHLLKTVRLDGSQDTTLFTRKGDAMWATSAAGHGEIGEHIALSPTGGRIALLSGTSNVQMPGALLTVGCVEVWDLVKKTGIKTDIRAVDDGFAWFSDGKRLAYVKLIDAKTVTSDIAKAVTSHIKPDDPFGKHFDGWKQVPAVYIRDVDAGTEAFVHVGSAPVVSPNGAKIMLCDLYGNYKLVDIATGKAIAVGPPGEVFDLSDSGAVLTRSMPTAGATLRYTDNNSPLSGPKPMLAMKLFSLENLEFQTVIPYIDPRMKVSFGRVDAK